MAVRPQRIHDGGIVERRLRPIYDWLDNGNNKKALQEAEKVLKKSPTLQAARALKALALLRLGKASECHAVLDALVEEKPSDDTTLQAMTISYRESHQLPKVCEIYEAAVKVDPTNEELYSHLFMSYVRIGDHRSQQRTAMALYKFAPKNPYYFWAVMSIVLQAKTADDSTKRNILLALAQRMVENFITENKMEAEQEARLYIMILELQEKWGDILKFIESPLYSQLVPGSTSQACIPYFKKIGEWRRLNLLCKDLLWDNQDRWDFYMPYFDSVFQLMKKQSAESENSVDDTPEKCHEFICSIVESMSSGRMLRGPYLARLELWKRLAQGGDPTSLLGSGAALCLQYLRVFANKTCAVPDLKPYLSMLAQKEREDHSRDFLTCLGFDENSEPDNTNDIQRHVSCLSAWRLTAPSGTAEENINIANLLRRHYLRCLEKGLVTATLTEFCAADSYGTLAAHHYFYAAVEQENPAPIIEALNLLELVLHHSPANFHAKLLLISLYHILGNALAADSIYNKLEVKHIQLVSLGWLHAARLAPALAPARALRLLADTCAFHKHHAKDSVEQVTYAYKFGTFEKVAEVWAWGARVEACAWCAACGRDRALLALLAGPQPLQPLHRLPHAPTDNRDLNAIVSWCGAEAEREQRKARSFERDVAYLRLKDGLLSAIALCIECADNRSVDEKSSQFEELRVCIAAFGDALDTCRGVYGARDPLSVCAPLPSRIIALVTSPVPYRELYTSALGVVCEVCGGRHARAHAAAERAGRALAASRGHLAAHARPDLWRNRDALEFYSNYLEFIGVITFLLGVCNEFVAPANAKKSKKKTSQSPEQIKTIEMLNQLNDQVQQTIAQLEDIFENWPKFEYDTSLEDEFAKLNITNKYQSPVEQKLKSGMDDVLADVKNILKKKAKYLKSLQ
ncbi:phagocyte signaling-impaired protein [Zerene cesonia]|uniref:phagocyte signaling-impaired protein n=1 Tax=Zerene cesonia TaxID=33412 RepID=UPI0018E51B93|nr:phagocyte signaling-impaired protein [Zerene cesonia]